MASSGGAPPPKKRRIEDILPPEDPIAQANSTLKIFMGSNQRQNRWMSGYTLDQGNEQVPARTQPPVASSRAVNSHQVPQQRAAARDTQTSTAPGTASIVNYESPIASTPLSSNAAPPPNSASRKSMDRVASGGSVVGLPSPVSSDGAMNSPATAFEGTTPRRGRPPKDTMHSFPVAGVLPSNGSPAVRAHSTMQPPPQPRQQQYAQNTQQFHPNSHLMPIPSNAGALPVMHTAHGHPPAPVHPTGVPNPQQMLHYLDNFEQKVLPKLGNTSHVDFGRISLLREAIEKLDWFYICLSQIHCLLANPQLLPGAAGTLSHQATSYLDTLLCPSSKLNPHVLKWLSEFPASIQSIYSSPAQNMYDKIVQDVVRFIQRLPKQWDPLVSECRTRGTPPLMDDLLDRFALQSLVLQTTIFRAITRMVKDGSESLEQLHHLDQEAFRRGQTKRTPYEKEAAYHAFRETINKLRVHEQTPAHLRKRFIIPPAAVGVFQVRLFAPAPPPTQASPINHFNPSQQPQPPPRLNCQRASHTRQPSINSSGSPAQPATPTNNTMTVNYGNIAMPRQQHPPSRRLILPHETEQPRAQPTHPDTMRSALHQAHLRSPQLKSAAMESPRLYRHVVGFALSPRKINKALPMEVITFDISQELYETFPANIDSEQPGAPASRSLNIKSCTIRLRCASGKDNALMAESAWMEADNYWPDNLFLQCNQYMLEPRRKLHHNRYLPIDLTAMVKPGRNELTVIVNRMSTDNRPYDYALAVEIVGVTDHTAISENMKAISAAKSLQAIKDSLAADDGGDDIAITSSTTIIKLFDPHTLNKIFHVPVRGAACLHKDCFDLETFLSQRDPKNTPDTPSAVDCWRCPICRGDVRPQTLIRDGFMDQVREQLAQKGMLNTGAIVVEPDGSWKPKEEDGGGVRSPSLEREERGSSAKATSTTKAVLLKGHEEVIVIDD